MFTQIKIKDLRVLKKDLLLNGKNQEVILGEETPSKGRLEKIEANYYLSHHIRVQALLSLLKKAQRFELSPEEQKLATFFVAKNKELGIYGGAVLLKKKISNCHRNCASRFAFQGEQVWTCSLVLHLANKDPVYMSRERIAFCRTFYEELYDHLVTFGKQKGVPFLWVTVDSGEALCLEELGSFPFILKIKPQDTVDGLFRGLLSLRQKGCRL